MEMRDLLEKMMKFAGEKEGQKPGDQWKGTDSAPPGKKLVGDSILKDLSKGPTPKTKEQELAEEFQAFLEAEFKDTVDKRPARKNARHPRGHEPQPRYKTVKANENVDEGTLVNVNALLSRADHSGTTAPWWARTSDTNYMGSSSEEKNLKYKLYFPDMFRRNNLDYHFEGDPKKALFAAKQLGFEQDDQGKWYFPVYNTLPVTKNKITRSKYYFGEKPTKVLPKPEEIAESRMSEKDIELQDYRSMSHKEFQNAYKMTKTEWINRNKALVIQNPDIKKSLGINESQYRWEVIDKDGNIKAVYNHNSQYYGDETAASDIQYTLKSNPGSTIKATKDGEEFKWQSLLDETDSNDKVEARWIVKVSDDEGVHLKTFRDEFPNLAAAKEAYKKHKPYASDFKYTSIKKNKVKETVDTFNRAGYNPISDERDYLDKLSKLSNLYRQQGLDQTMKAEIFQRINDLNAEARKKGYIQAESRAHKTLSTFFKNRELQDKFAKGELKIPTPQERQSQLKKLEKAKPVKEYGAANPPQKTSPAQAQQVAANLNVQKTALNQLKQINPEIDPAKAAAAMTKDTATMSPQEKDELAQVAKTVSPALGTPAFGSIKTAIQKSQIK